MSITNKVSDISGQAVVLRDALVNLVANIGTGMDKAAQSFYTKKRRKFPTPELEAMYTEGGLYQKVVEIIPEDMTREWRSFNDAKLTEDNITIIQKEEKRLDLQEKVKRANMWARLYGGGVIVMNVQNTGEPWEELTLDMVTEGSLACLTVYDSENCKPARINNSDPLKPNFNLPETYRLTNSSTEIHHSRILRFDGQILPFNLLRRNEYWHDSVLNAIFDAFLNLDNTLQNTAGMVFESNVDVIKVKNLMTSLATGGGTDTLVDRFTLAKTIKANNNLTLLDADEDYIKSSNSFSGLAELIKVFMVVAAAVADVPMTRLFNEAAKGLNNGGEENTRNYYDKIRAKQEAKMSPQLNWLDQIIAASLGLDPENMEFKWNSLWQESDETQANIDKVTAETRKLYYDMAILKSSTIAKELMNDKSFSALTPEDITEIEKLEKEASEYDDDAGNDDGLPGGSPSDGTGDKPGDVKTGKSDPKGDE